MTRELLQPSDSSAQTQALLTPSTISAGLPLPLFRRNMKIPVWRHDKGYCALEIGPPHVRVSRCELLQRLRAREPKPIAEPTRDHSVLRLRCANERRRGRGRRPMMRDFQHIDYPEGRRD